MTTIGKRPASVQNADFPKKKAKTGKEKKGPKKGNVKSETTPEKEKKRKRKKYSSGSIRRTAVFIGEDVTSINQEKTVKNACNLSAKIHPINLGEKPKSNMDEIK